MSLTLTESKDNSPIAVIRGNSNKKLKNEVVYASHMSGGKSFQSLELEGDQFFQPIPNPHADRSVLFCAGKSGSGKSTYAAKYMAEYKKIFPDNPIYVFSLINDDATIDAVGVQRIKIDSSLQTHPINIEDFGGECFVLFDDIDVIKDAKLKVAVYNIMDQILELGRHSKLTVLVTNHLLTNGAATRRILNEADYITIFPSSGSFGGIQYCLTKYVGLDRHQIKKIRNLKSRWVTIRNTAPMLILSHGDCYMLATDEGTK